MHTSSDFVLHGGDTAFANRQRLLFDRLSVAEKECNVSQISSVCTDVNMDDTESHTTQPVQRAGQKRKSETKRFRGKESIFKRPEGPAPRAVSRNIPDHRRNPHKWVKYSLDDVSNDDMTDKSNTQTALSFLRELKARRLRERAGESQEEMDMDDDESTEQDQAKIVFKSRKIKKASTIEFKKPSIDVEKTESSPVIIDHDDKPIFRSSKIIMPEYVVGQKQKKKTKKEKPLTKVDRLKQLKLDHLEELEEEEN